MILCKFESQPAPGSDNFASFLHPPFPMPTAVKRPGRPSSSKARIVEAAIRCIEAQGIDQLTMEAVAAEAGVVRKTVYLAFGNRQALIQAVLMTKVGSNVEQVRRYVNSFDTLAEALVQGCLRHMELIRKDHLFFDLVLSADISAFDRYFLGPNAPVQGMALDIWRDALQRARERGELRPDVTDTEVANWLAGVMSFLLVRDDLSPQAKGSLLTKFLLPALLA